MTDFPATYGKLKKWLFEDALPIWSTIGVDRNGGGFFEKIDHHGQAVESPRRTRLVARQIFSFVAADEMGWDGPCAELIDHGLEFLHGKCIAPNGLAYSEVEADGTPVRKTFDTYDHAFALFALAAATQAGYRAGQNREAAERMLTAMRDGWSNPVAGFYESQPPAAPMLANPHMHLFEAALEWTEVSDENSKWHVLADELGELALDRLCDPRSGAIVETYDLDWRPIADAGLGFPVVEPGHQFEWAWLLTRWGSARENQQALTSGRRLIEIGETHGVDAQGLCFNTLNPQFEPIDCDRRLWPQTERAKANLLVGNETNAEQALSGLSRYFATPVPGLWYETLREDGSPVSEPAKASSLYHIICALRETHRYLISRP